MKIIELTSRKMQLKPHNEMNSIDSICKQVVMWQGDMDILVVVEIWQMRMSLLKHVLKTSDAIIMCSSSRRVE